MPSALHCGAMRNCCPQTCWRSRAAVARSGSKLVTATSRFSTDVLCRTWLTWKPWKLWKLWKLCPLVVSPSWHHRVTHKQHSSCVQLRWGHRKEVPTWSSVSRFSKPSKRALRRLGNIGSQEVKNGERRRKWAESLGEIREILIRCRSQSCARQRRCFAFCLSPESVPLSSQDVVFRCFP